MKEPRPHHYIFAHRVLPALFLNDPPKFIETISAGQDNFVHWLWKRVGEKEVQNASDRIAPNGLSCAIMRAEDNATVAIVTLPPPEGMTEAYFVALVYWPQEDAALAPAARYITLEHGMQADGSPRTVLCEWTKEMHANYGNGPEPVLQTFFEAVRALIQKTNQGES